MFLLIIPTGVLYQCNQSEKVGFETKDKTSHYIDTLYYDDGTTIKAIFSYNQDSILDGNQYTYRDDGTLEFQVPYKTGVPHGLMIEFCSNGNPEILQNLTNGKELGERLILYCNGEGHTWHDRIHKYLFIYDNNFFKFSREYTKNHKIVKETGLLIISYSVNSDSLNINSSAKVSFVIAAPPFCIHTMNVSVSKKTTNEMKLISPLYFNKSLSEYMFIVPVNNTQKFNVVGIITSNDTLNKHIVVDSVEFEFPLTIVPE